MEWKTFLILYFGTNGRKPTEVEKGLEEIGFKTQFGSVDFVYDWNEEPTKEKVLALADKIAEALKGSGAVFNIDTQEK